MLIDIKTDADFDRSVEQLKYKYGEAFEYLNGLHPTQLNLSDFIDNFVDKNNTANATIDANANVSTKDIRNLLTEKDKPIDKLFAFSKIFYEFKKIYGLETAKKWLDTEWSGGFYMHDASTSTYLPYCYAYDLDKLATQGLFFLDHYNNLPPQHLTTFVDDVIEYISFMSNRSSGAVGIPNILIWTYYFWKKDVKEGYYIKSPEYHIKQIFQKLIYRLNQPFMRIDQTAFVNVSIFDRFYVESLFGGVEFPDGSFLVDDIDEFIEHEKIFMNVVSEIRSQNMFTFPILTYSLLYNYDTNEFADLKFARWCSDHNTTWNDSNFFISDNVGVLSNCCFDGSQLTLTKSSNGVNLLSFKDIYNTSSNENQNFAIFHNGSWVKGDIIKLPARRLYKITTMNNKQIIVTDNHINPTLNGDKKTKKLTTNDYLLFNTDSLDSYKEKNQHLTYEQGFLLGMYLGDGSKAINKNDYTINLSINQNKYELSKNILNKSLVDLGEMELSFVLGKEYNNAYSIVTKSKKVVNFINEYITGDYSNEKELNMDVLFQSKKFRRGILDGYYLTNGGNSNQIYTSSEKLVHQFECLMTSLGINSIISISDRNDASIIIQDNEYDRNFPLYCIRWYDGGNCRTENDVFIKKNNSTYFKIKSIEKYHSDDDSVYCFDMSNKEEPYFTLPNGIITHNCRLLSDTSKLSAFINSIGGTALSIGSVKVNTINLVKIAYETSSPEDYYKLLKDRVELCCKTLFVQRHIIKRNIEKGLLPNYTDGGIEMSKQYSTVGIIGLYEAAKHFGYIKFDEFGNAFWTPEGEEFATHIFNIINETKDSFTTEFSLNCESVPAEKAAIILCQKDNLLYGKNDEFIYSNQWIPLSQKCSIEEKLRTCSLFDAKCSGGAISHINLESNFPNTDMAWEALNNIAKHHVIYSAFNTRINECKNHHGFVGTNVCPTCGEPVYDTYQRIVGYLVPTRNYSKERFAEFNARQWYEYARFLSE